MHGFALSLIALLDNTAPPRGGCAAAIRDFQRVIDADAQTGNLDNLSMRGNRPAACASGADLWERYGHS